MLNKKEIMIFCYLSILAFYSNIYSQDNLKLSLAKYYVAYYELQCEIEAFLLNKTVSLNKKNINILPVELIEDNYNATKYKDSFLVYEVYMVYNNEVHAKPYKLGIDEYFNIIKLSGFNKYVNGTEISENDSLIVNDFKLYLKSSKEIDDFVEQLVAFSKYDDIPKFIKLLENKFYIENNSIIGNCKTEELNYFDYKQVKMRKDWKYSIPQNGRISIELVKSDKKE